MIALITAYGPSYFTIVRLRISFSRAHHYSRPPPSGLLRPLDLSVVLAPPTRPRRGHQLFIEHLIPHYHKLAMSSDLAQASGRDAPATSRARRQRLIDQLDNDTVPTKIVYKAPAQRYQLNFLDVTCLLINRMIGECCARPSSCFYTGLREAE